MDLMGLKYTHSGLETSVIAIDKELTKMVLVPHGIRMPEGGSSRARASTTRDPLPRPYVLKPVNEGSSVGVAIVTRRAAITAIRSAATSRGRGSDFDRLLAEPFIRGPRADRRGARRRGAGGDRAAAQVRLLRL